MRLDGVSMNTWLAHHGIKGQKCGVRRFQNEDGSLTEAGKARQNMIDSHNYYKQLQKQENKNYNKVLKERRRFDNSIREEMKTMTKKQYLKRIDDDEQLSAALKESAQLGKQHEKWRKAHYSMIDEYTKQYGKDFVDYVLKEIKNERV